MPSATPAPWSIPYPVGTDRVMDGDNAMQAIAERVAAIQAGTVYGPWTALPMVNGWKWFGPPHTRPAYRRVGDRVELMGMLNGGPAGVSVIANLPAGWRPFENMNFPAVATNVGGTVSISFTGVVTCEGGYAAGGWLAINGITFATTALP